MFSKKMAAIRLTYHVDMQNNLVAPVYPFDKPEKPSYSAPPTYKIKAPSQLKTEKESPVRMVLVGVFLMEVDFV